MLFDFNAHSALLLPFAVPGAVAATFLVVRAVRTGSRADLLLAGLLAWPTLAIGQWLLGYAGWFDSHDRHSTFMFYVPWQLHLSQGPLWYLYFRSLTNQDFRLRPRAWLHLLPGLLEIGLFVAVAVLDLGWRRGVRGEALPDFFGTKGAAATWRDGLFELFAAAGYALLLGYGLATLRAYRRYRRYLDDNFSQTERLRFAGLRQVLILLLVGLVLSLVYTALEAVLGEFSYDTAWYAFAVRGALIYALVVVGLQANYAAATSPLRFEDVGAGLAPARIGEQLPLNDRANDAGNASLDDNRATIWAGASPAPTPEPAPQTLPPELLPWRDKLLALMDTEQPWLEPELTLTELAHRLRLAPALLSRVINTGCGQNFNDFVNTYRVQAAAQRLADPRYGHYSLMGVGLDCGFNSKSTFNRVFKKLAGHPPGEVMRPKL